MKVLVFDVYGDYGHFRKNYTTSSPCTYRVPPIPTVKGMIGAIMGYSRETYLQILSNELCSIGLNPLTRSKKVMMGLNYINTKDNVWVPKLTKAHAPYTQVKIEYIKLPKYRIYLSHKDEVVFDQLCKQMEAHKNVFTLSMGLSELLADYKVVGVFNFKEEENVTRNIKSICCLSSLVDSGMVMECDKRYVREQLPLNMSENRIVTQFEQVIYEDEGKGIKAKVQNCWTHEETSVILY